MLVSAEVKDILINTHYLADRVEAFIKNGKFSEYVTFVYEDSLLGTGGTLLKNKDFFHGDAVMLVHADNLSKFDMASLIKAHTQRPADTEITMMTFTTDSPQTCGIVELDKRGIVVAFHEKVADPPGNLANGAVYILEPAIFDFLSKIGKKEIDFSNDVLPYYIGKIYTFHNDIYHRDIGNLESYNTACKEFG